MTDTNYLYQYFLEKSPEDKKAKSSTNPSENVKTKKVEKELKECKENE